MSNYPPPPYGGSYHDQNNAPYPPPHNYQNTYPQTDNGHGSHAQGNAASNYGAYGYNGVIHGFNPAAVPSVAPIPIFQGWNQDSVPLPPYTAPPNVPSYPGYQNTPHAASQYYPAFNQTGYQHSLPPPQRALNQRELSEGEFDEGANAANPPPADHSAGQYKGNEGANYGKNARQSMYSQPQGYNSRQSPAPVTNHNSPVDEDVPARRGSDSYSPCISPQEMNNDQSRPNDFQRQTSVGQQSASAFEPTNMHNRNLPNSTTYQARVNSMTNSNMPKAVESFILNTNGQQLPVDYSANARIVAQARSRAQNAVLDMWPHVEYAAFLAEGFRENTVNDLFDGAKISKETGKDSHQRFSLGNQRAANHNHIPNRSKSPSTSNDNIGLTGATGYRNNITNGNKAKPLSLSTSLPAPVQSQSGMGSATTPVLPQTPTTLNEKELKLQAKMEALRKSREERAQKAAAQKTGKAPSTQAQAPPAAEDLSRPTAHEEKSPVGQDEALATFPKSPIEMKSQASPLHLPTPPPPSSQLQISDTTSQSILVIKPSADSQTLPPPSIPGLFLASPAPIPPPANSQNNMHSGNQSNTRKRPVAADFDNTTPPVPAKRPFGHSRVDESLVINVSEDDESDDEDVAMDLDSNQDSPVQAPRRLSDHRISAIQNLPTISNFPRPGFNPSSSPAANTPPIPLATSRPPPVRPAELQRKESQIEELKRRIAQAEARSKARQTPSGTRTPVSNQTAHNLANATNTTASDAKRPDVPEARNPVPTHVESLIGQISAPQQIVTQNVLKPALLESATPDVQVDSVELHVECTDSENVDEEYEELLRQEELSRQEVVMHANELAQTQKQLDQMKADVVAKEQAIEEAAIKLRQAEERELRIQEEKQLRLQQQKQIAAENLKAAIALPLPPIIPALEDRDVTRNPSVEKANLPLRPTSAHSTRSSRPSVNEQLQAIDRSLSPIAAEKSTSPAANVFPAANGTSNEVVLAQGDKIGSAVQAEAPDNNMASANALEAALQEAVRAEADSHSLDEGEVDVDMEVSYAPDPTELAPVTPAEEKDSPAYSPRQHGTSNSLPVEDEEEDDYEPPEATPPADSPPFSPAPPAENNLPVFDEVMQEVVPSISDNSGRPLVDAEDKQSALPVLNGSAPVSEVPREVDSIRYFTPYVSPLRIFRAYRFHPQFKSEVTGGLRSLTYSHEIDPNAELCRYELAGGICNDTTCYCLHFKDIGYKDSLILAALGSPNQFKGPRFAAFRQGLTDVLNELRVKKIRDFDVIASEILAYRAKFLGDESKILPLEGITV